MRRNLFLLLLKCSAWQCLGTARQDLHTFFSLLWIDPTKFWVDLAIANHMTTEDWETQSSGLFALIWFTRNLSPRAFIHFPYRGRSQSLRVGMEFYFKGFFWNWAAQTDSDFCVTSHSLSSSIPQTQCNELTKKRPFLPNNTQNQLILQESRPE